MTRTFSFLFLFLFLASCGKGGSGGGSGSGAADMADAQLSSEKVPVQAQTFDINAKLSGFDRDQEEKIHKAFELIKKVVASDEFKKQVLNKKHNGKKKYFDNGGLTNEQIYNKILAGSEMLNKAENNTMDLEIAAYSVEANVIGYTKPSILKIFMNTRYLNKPSFGTNQVAMNVIHEWLHKLGFKHSQENTPNRPHSVPYAVGYIMRDLAAKLD